MSPSPQPAAVHIPAWKRIGLKLKFAKEEPQDINGVNSVQNQYTYDRKRKAADINSDSPSEATDARKPVKKLQKTRRNDGPEATSEGGDTSAANGQRRSPSRIAARDSPKTIRKSVSFTPETKIQDGEGVKELYKTWFDKQVVDDPSFDPSTVSPALRAVTPATADLDESAFHLKSTSSREATSNSSSSHKKSKKTKREKPEDEPNHLPLIDHPALTYLTTHHTSPTIWKFSKPYQNHLLKHLFSFTHVPTSYDSALLGYLRGLQGSARSRTRQQALAIRSEDAKWLSAEPLENDKMDQETDAQCIARRKRDYDAAVARVKQRLRDIEDDREEREWELLGDKEEWEQQLRKRRRAELVLWGVGEDEAEDAMGNTAALPKSVVSRKNGERSGEYTTVPSKGMGGVGRISNGGIAKGSAGKKIVFGENVTNGVYQAQGPSAVDGVKRAEGMNGVNGVQIVQKRKRKNKRRKTGVPDDDSSSSSESSSSSSSDEESEEEEEEKAEMWKSKGKRQKTSGNGMSSGEPSSISGSNSSSDSETSSSEDSDPD